MDKRQFNAKAQRNAKRVIGNKRFAQSPSPLANYMSLQLSLRFFAPLRLCVELSFVVCPLSSLCSLCLCGENVPLLKFDRRHTDDRQQQTHNPKTDHHLGLRPSLILEMVMQRRTEEDPLLIAQTEARYL